MGKKKVRRKPSKVEQAANEIREVYRLGREIRDGFGNWAEYRAVKQAEEDLRAMGLTPEKARKLRQIAERYTEDELEQLLAWCSFYDRPIGVSYLFKTVSIPTTRASEAALRKRCSGSDGVERR